MVMNEKETGIRKSGRKLWACSLLMLLFLVLMSTTALAAKTGWKQVGKRFILRCRGGRQGESHRSAKDREAVLLLQQKRRDENRLGKNVGGIPVF